MTKYMETSCHGRKQPSKIWGAYNEPVYFQVQLVLFYGLSWSDVGAGLVKISNMFDIFAEPTQQARKSQLTLTASVNIASNSQKFQSYRQDGPSGTPPLHWSKFWFYIPFNSQGHIEIGPQHLSLVGVEPAQSWIYELSICIHSNLHIPVINMEVII